MKKTRLGYDVATPWRGFLLIVIIAIAVVLSFFLDAMVRATTEGEQITILTSTAPHLRPGSAVWVAGRPVGRVLSVDFKSRVHDGPNVVIRAVLKRSTSPFVRADARVEVRTSDLLAPVVVAIDPGSGSAAPWDYGDTLRSSARRLNPETIMALADTLLEGVQRLQTQARKTKLAVETGSGSLQRIQQDPQLLRDMREDLEQMRAILENDLPHSSLARLASDTILGPTINRVWERLADWNESPDRETMLLSAEAATEAFDSMGRRLQRVIRSIEVAEGTVGRMLMDRELTNQVELLKAQIANLSEYLARRPSIWLRVKAF